MQLHQIKPIHKNKRKKRRGRGGKRGTFSGRGVKGQKSRAGRKMQPIIRELIKRYHKKRGYRNKGKEKREVILNLSVLEKLFAEGEKITPQLLLSRRIIRKIKARVPDVKILGKGELKKKLIIEGCRFSKAAKEKIERAGGNIA